MIITTEKGGKFTKGGKAILPTVYGFEEIAEKDLFQCWWRPFTASIFKDMTESHFPNTVSHACRVDMMFDILPG